MGKVVDIGNLSHDEGCMNSNIESIAKLILKQILDFFNQVSDPYEVTSRIKDDPGFGKSSRGVGLSLARKVIAVRDSLPSSCFDSILDIIAIRGLGSDTLHDILYTFVCEEGLEKLKQGKIIAGGEQADLRSTAAVALLEYAKDALSTAVSNINYIGTSQIQTRKLLERKIGLA